MNELAAEGSNPDEWGEMVVEELVTAKRAGRPVHLDSYDTVLVDEGQDMSAWQLTLLDLHQAEQATFCVAFGKGQELYEARTRDSGSVGKLTEKALRRNFRNARRVYFAAHAFYEGFPDRHSAIEKAALRFLVGKDKELAFDFDGDGATAIRYVAPAPLDRELEQAEHMVQQYREVLLREVEELQASDVLQPIDLLVLVPTAEGTNAEWGRRALKTVCKEKGIDFIDYTDEDLRRVSPNNNQVRLCTFHSARGLEGARVVLLGFETIANAVKGEVEKVRNLGFIALSRAVYGSVAVIRPELTATAASDLLSKIMLAQNERAATNRSAS